MQEMQPIAGEPQGPKKRISSQKTNTRNINQPIQWVDESRIAPYNTDSTPPQSAIDYVFRDARASFAIDANRAVAKAFSALSTPQTTATPTDIHHPTPEVHRSELAQNKKRARQASSSATASDHPVSVIDLAVESFTRTQQQQKLAIERVKNSVFLSCFMGAYIQHFNQVVAARGNAISLKKSLTDMNIHTLLELPSPLLPTTVQELEAYVNALSLTNFTHRMFHIMMTFEKPQSSFVEEAQKMLSTLNTMSIFSLENYGDFSVSVNDIRTLIEQLLTQHANIKKHLTVIAEGSGHYVIQNNLLLTQQVIKSGFLTYLFSALKTYAYTLSHDKSPQSVTPILTSTLRVSGLDKVILGRNATEEEVYNIYILSTTNIDAISRELVFFDDRHEWYTLLTRALNEKFFAPHQISELRSILTTCSEFAQQALNKQKETQARLKKLAEVSRSRISSTSSHSQTASSSSQQPTQGQETIEFFDQDLLVQHGLDEPTHSTQSNSQQPQQISTHTTDVEDFFDQELLKEHGFSLI